MTVSFGTRASRAIADRDREARRDLRVGFDGFVPVAFTEFAPSLGITLTSGQTALARVAFDGLDPIDVGPEAVELYGGVSRIPQSARRVNVLRLGRGSGKTTLAGAFSIYTMLTADLSQAGPGDQPAIISIAPTRRTAQLSVSMGMSLVEQSPDLRPRVVHANSEGFSLRRHDGRRVQFRALPKSRGGAAARGMSILGAIFDEAEFLPTEELSSASVTDREIVQAIMPRLMRHGRVWLISTPWPVASLTSELFDLNYGSPQDALCARAPTLIMRDNDPTLLEVIEAERRRDPDNAAREFDCLNVTTGAAFFDGRQIESAVIDAPRTSDDRRVSVGIDLAFRGDSSTLVAVQRQGRELVVIRVEERTPAKGAPLVPSVVIGEFAQITKDLGADSLVCDGHYIDAVREHAASTAGIGVHEGPKNTADKARMFTHARELLREGAIVLPRHTRLLAQLKNVKARHQQGGGMSIMSDRKGNAHGDLVSALVQAIYFDRRFGHLREAERRIEFAAGTTDRASSVTLGRGRITDTSRSRWGGRR